MRQVVGQDASSSLKQEAGIEFPKAKLSAARVEMATTYRQDLQVRRRAGGPQELRVLVTMGFPIGTGFTYYSVPLNRTPQEKKP